MEAKSQQQTTSDFLHEQYGHIEEYCQRQTQLKNLSVTQHQGSSSGGGDAVLQAVEQVQQALLQVQSDLRRLHSMVAATENEYLKHHLAVVQRVLQTVYEGYHVHGVPVMQLPSFHLNPTEIKIIALATLRASIAQVQQSE